MYLCASLNSEWVLGSGSLLTLSITLQICIPAFAPRVNKFKRAILKQRSSAKLHQESLSMFHSVEPENQSLENQIIMKNSYSSFRLLALMIPLEQFGVQQDGLQTFKMFFRHI